ncbi:TetR/AcrR family transcriptional regulator [Alteriqipengyuania sp. NZ-12B]|uniref:TetR/AcrR family transcriptional regulator n=1 Tax=Alteriqipengyuania abyssalis TaxID=2860200 RepID=A0ABS7P8S4_9SPHN|nr:TetR/AcrR family transcriptional regulator [Alteriqipengyuania abyssalis]MBY8335462.1 TetR/AcrR family transcriptional regulator [Alteriqipengyuania abyssalis]
MSSIATNAREASAGANDSLKSEFVAFKTNRIIEVASNLFYQRGYSSCTLDLVADNLGVTKPFLYSYFKNKEAILAAICEVGISESLAVLEATLADEHKTHRALLTEVVRQVGRIVIERQEYVVVYQREMKHLSATDHNRILRMRASFDHQIAELIREGVEAGEFREDTDSFVAVWIGGLISWIPTWYSPGGQRSSGEVIDQLVTAALRLAGAE